MMRLIADRFHGLASKWTSVAVQRRKASVRVSHTNFSAIGNRQLLVDVSVIAQSDGRTGIQRVVRNIYLQLLKAPPSGYHVCPVMATRKQGYHYLPQDFLHAPATKTVEPINCNVVRVQSGDLFLGLDLAAHIIPHRLFELVGWKRQGVRMCFFVYDLLPILEPTWFNSRTTQNFRRWLRALAILADDAICISNTVAKDFTAWMLTSHHLNGGDIRCSTIPLGANIQPVTSGSTYSAELERILSLLGQRTSVLMVGTLEPRKGHAEILDAFEKLWARGANVNLVIAGKPGWKVEPLIRRIQNHPEAGKRLVWLESPSDEVLLGLYRNASGLIMASKGEGFGLPLAEAAYFGKPVLARDIPVFREVAGNTATFFTDRPPNNVDDALASWISALESGEIISASSLNCATWEESCMDLVRVLFEPCRGDKLSNDININLTPVQEPQAALCKLSMK